MSHVTFGYVNAFFVVGVFFSSKQTKGRVAERLVPRLKNTIEGLPDQKLPTRGLGKLFMVMELVGEAVP